MANLPPLSEVVNIDTPPPFRPDVFDGWPLIFTLLRLLYVTTSFIICLQICTDESKLGSVLSDLVQRRAQIVDIGVRHNTKVVNARAPLAELHDYATVLRTLSSGLASFSMQVSDYEQMSEDHRRTVVFNAIGVHR